MMSTQSCDAVAERVALGEPIGELAEHVATCARCQRTVDMPAKLGATHHEVDPGLGFAARMTVGAQHRLAVRRRNRIAGGLAATVAAGALAVFVMTRPPAKVDPPTIAADPNPTKDEPVTEPASDEDLAALINLADVDRSSRLSARWSHINKPLSPYRKLLQGLDKGVSP